jgi:hypothetical protein
MKSNTQSKNWITNKLDLAKINATLTPDQNTGGKIGIFLPGKNGDIITAMSVLKYRDTIFPNKKIIWFCNYPNADAFKFSPISEVRTYEWEHISVDPYTQLKNSYNKLNQERKLDFDLTKDLEDAYFPAPWMANSYFRDNTDYPSISKKIFGISPTLEWHPYLCFSNEEREMIKDFCLKLPYKKTIMLETSYESGQSGWNDNFTKITIDICREKLGPCNFIFASLGDNSKFFDDIGVVSASHFTVRQTALINNYSDLFIGTSSGISVATSCWNNKPTPKIQFCNSFICSTVPLANGSIDLVAPNNYQNRFYGEEKLALLEIDYKLKLRQRLDTI